MGVLGDRQWHYLYVCMYDYYIILYLDSERCPTPQFYDTSIQVSPLSLPLLDIEDLVHSPPAICSDPWEPILASVI